MCVFFSELCVPTCKLVCVCLCLRLFHSPSLLLCVCVTVQGRLGSVSGNVCVCAAGTVRVCLPGAAWHGGPDAGGWTAGHHLQHHLQTEQKHSCYCHTTQI